MERKLISQGGGGYTMYLPKKWVSDNHLGKGDVMQVNEVGRDLIVSAQKSDHKSETEVTFTNEVESSIRTLVTNAYRTGYDKITINYKSDRQIKILQQILNKWILGFDITSKKDGQCVVENITEPDYGQFDNLVGKIFLNIDSLFESIGVKIGIEGEGEDINEIEERIIKYHNFCLRVISKHKLIRKNSELFWTFLALTIHAQRDLFHLNSHIGKKEKVSSKTIKLFEDARGIFNMIHEGYKKKDIDILKKIHEHQKRIVYDDGYSLLRNTKGNETIIVHNLISCARQFYLANSPLTGLLV